MDKEHLAECSHMLAVLFSAFPGTAKGDATTVQTYLEALQHYELEAVAKAVSRFIANDVDGYDGKFAPSLPILLKQVRVQQEALDVAAGRLKPFVPPNLLPPPAEYREDPPEVRAAFKARLVELAEVISAPDPERAEKLAKDTAERLAKHDRLFGISGPLSPTTMAKMGLVRTRQLRREVPDVDQD